MLLTGAQCLGAYAAAECSKQMEKAWPEATAVAPSGEAAGVKYADSSLPSDFAIAEEFLAVFALLVGFMHLLQCDIPFLLNLSSRPEPSKHRPIPIGMITSASLLVAGMSRAFPSAHLAGHVSVYSWIRGFNNNVTPWRILGGWLGTLGGVMYYYFTFSEKPGSAIEAFRGAVANPPNGPATMNIKIGYRKF